MLNGVLEGVSNEKEPKPLGCGWAGGGGAVALSSSNVKPKSLAGVAARPLAGGVSTTNESKLKADGALAAGAPA
ncbi:MAG: hypothetical protein ACXVJT_14365, partial [Thermoanaerobaculia bacterium]